MIGERLADVRKDHGDTQAALADRLKVSLSSIRSWEQEKSSPPHELLVSICKIYEVSSDYLLGLSDVDPAYVQRLRRASFGASIKSLNSFEAIASTVSEGCFQGYDPFRFPEVYDSITQQDLLDFIRDNIRPERMALSVIYPKE